MSLLAERTQVKAPCTYQEWLDCFELMKDTRNDNSSAFEAAMQGSFTGSELTEIALQQQLVQTVNYLLDSSTKRFIKLLNQNIAFNDLSQTDLLFRRLKKDVNRVFFFENLSFFPEKLRQDLAEQITTQMTDFWDSTVSFLYKQSLEFSNSELEDVLFLIKRIHLFNM